MPTLRAILAWLVLPLLVLLLLPETLRLLPMLRDGLLYEWLRDLAWRHRAGFGLLLLLTLLLPLLKRLQQHLDVLAARSLLPFWRDRRPGPGESAPVSHAGTDWRVSFTASSPGDRPPAFTAAPAAGPGVSARARRRFERLLLLAWYLDRDRREARAAGEPRRGPPGPGNRPA